MMKASAVVGVAAFVAAFVGCVTPPASLQQTDFHSALDRLIDGPETMTTATKAKLLQAPPQQLTAGMAGVSFGMTMQEVIDLWGRPNAVWMQGDGHIQLSISYSSFEFVRDRLVDISIHASDLESFAIADGKLAMGQPCPDLLALFPGSLPRDSSNEEVHEIALKGDVILRVQELDQKVISIQTIKE